jgi:hypothetical protein
MAISRAAAAALAVVIAALCLAAPAAGFYLPGVAPNDFQKVRLRLPLPYPQTSSSRASHGIFLSCLRAAGALSRSLRIWRGRGQICGCAGRQLQDLAALLRDARAMRAASEISADVIAKLRYLSFQTIFECRALWRLQRHVVWMFRNGDNVIRHGCSVIFLISRCL